MTLEIAGCIVDDHCNVIPFYHACWRAKRMLLGGLLYIHIDAHPDLCPPPLSIAQTTDLSTLYDSLDEEGGISEFILPLVAAGHLSEIVWLRPAWSQQISSGVYNYRYGDSSSGQGRVDFLHTYYLDDNHCCDSADLASDACKVRLSVCTVDDDTPSVLSSSSLPYVLDICLDYFITLNPFLQRLQELCAEHSIHLDISSLTAVLCYPVYRNLNAPLSLSQRYADQNEFYTALTTLSWSSIGAFISQYYDYAAFDICYVDASATMTVAELHNVLELYLPILANYPLPIREYIIEAKHLLLLPHQPLDWLSVANNIAACMEYLSTCSALQSPPQSISIARSDGDAYTPPDCVDKVLREVQHSIDRILVPMWQAKCGDSVVLNWHTLLGDDIYVQARKLFVKRKFQQLIA